MWWSAVRNRASWPETLHQASCPWFSTCWSSSFYDMVFSGPRVNMFVCKCSVMMDVGGWHRPKRWVPARNRRDGTSQSLIPRTHHPPTNTHMKTACYYKHHSGLGSAEIQTKQPLSLWVQVMETLISAFSALLIPDVECLLCVFLVSFRQSVRLWVCDDLGRLWFWPQEVEEAFDLILTRLFYSVWFHYTLKTFFIYSACSSYLF